MYVMSWCVDVIACPNVASTLFATSLTGFSPMHPCNSQSEKDVMYLVRRFTNENHLELTFT